MDDHACPLTFWDLPEEDPSFARVFSYLSGGKDFGRADQRVGDAMIAALPVFPRMVLECRAFLRRAVRYLVAELGVTQLVEVGCGFPVAVGNVHETAQAVDPSARVVYVDNDEVVLAHCRALMRISPEGAGPLGRIAVVAGDARAPKLLLDDPQVREVLDWDRPIALLLVATMECVDDEDAQRLVATLVEALPAGSYLVVGQASADFDPEPAHAAVAAAGQAGLAYHLRSHTQLTSLLNGLEVLEPGVVPMPAWRPSITPSDPYEVPAYAALARKP